MSHAALQRRDIAVIRAKNHEEHLSELLSLHRLVQKVVAGEGALLGGLFPTHAEVL